MMTMNEMKTNDTMKKTKDTTDDARECAPLVPAPPMRSGALASTPRESTSRVLATARAAQATATAIAKRSICVGHAEIHALAVIVTARSDGEHDAQHPFTNDWSERHPDVGPFRHLTVEVALPYSATVCHRGARAQQAGLAILRLAQAHGRRPAFWIWPDLVRILFVLRAAGHAGRGQRSS